MSLRGMSLLEVGRMNVGDFVKELRAAPWVLLLTIAVLAACYLPIWPGVNGRTTMEPYVIAWFGGVFKEISGGIVGWWFIRRVLRLNISEIRDENARALAGIGAGIVLAAFVVSAALAL